MIDLKQLRERPDEVRAALARRGAALDEAVNAALELDRQRRAILQEVERLKAQRNRASEEVAQRKQAGTWAADLVEQLKGVSARIKSLDQDLSAVESQLRERLLALPNLPLPEVHPGDASANEVVRVWREPAPAAPLPRAHWDIGAALGILDLPRGAKVAGSGFPLLWGAGARLARALVNFMIDLHVREHGYVEVAPPLLVNRDSALGTGQLPDLENNMYVTEDGLYLIPTAEVPVTNVHRDEILMADELPRAYVAYTPCFRREAGAHGKDTRGLIRIHQFDKVELVQFVRPEESRNALEALVRHAEAVLRLLELPYRVVRLAAGELGFASAMTYDLEVWAPGVAKWLEASSASTFTDFQARRAKIRYRPHPGAKPDYVHTLNASGVALPRTIIALLENNLDPDGSVRIPQALVPYLGTDRLVPGGVR